MLDTAAGIRAAPGVMRAELLAEGHIAERVLNPRELRRAEGTWLVSSLREMRRAVLID
jgi:branched-subunit amino acid aminotransferase/4-amino-4-deoxychorismate lyase